MKTYEDYRQLTENALKAYFMRPAVPQQLLLDAMGYSVLAGGKRLRGVLVLAFCEACGGSAEDALPVARAVEMLHAYSLIHDDLPCMDDDDLRRGKPTNHKVYGECTAVLAGDALQAEAFGEILRAPLSADVRARCAAALADAAGVDGICGGQLLDMEGEGKPLTESELNEINSRKTGSLFAAACRMGAICGGASPAQEDAAVRYAYHLGVAFQIRDDMLDVLSTTEDFGKPVGSDAASEKNTFMRLYGAEKCMELILALTEKAVAELDAFENRAFLAAFVRSLADRKN